MTSPRTPTWRVPTLLIALALVPLAAGLVRLTQLTLGAAVTPENARFFASPAPVVAHILAIVPFTLLAPLQFVPALRRRRWHRLSGRVVVVSGTVVALSGLWMTLFYPRPPADGMLLEWFRFLFGSAMLASIGLGFAAIRNRDIARHRAWMMRGYAIGMGAGTQVLTHLPWLVLVGPPAGFPRALLMLAGWVINLAVVEWFLRRTPGRTADVVRRVGGDVRLRG